MKRYLCMHDDADGFATSAWRYADGPSQAAISFAENLGLTDGETVRVRVWETRDGHGTPWDMDGEYWDFEVTVRHVPEVSIRWVRP